jgi:hypothetical protein
MADILPLKAGDLVVCVDEHLSDPPLTRGQEYRVSSTRICTDLDTLAQFVSLDAGSSPKYLSTRFQLMATAEASEPYHVKSLEELDGIFGKVAENHHGAWPFNGQPAPTPEQCASVANLLASADAGLITESDAVNLPAHYARFKIEPIRFICENGLNFFQGNIVKYVLRSDAKNGLEDLRKAQRYLSMWIKFLEGDEDWWRPEPTTWAERYPNAA